MKYIPKAVTRTIAKQGLRLQNQSPTILFAAGVVGMGTTIVLACRATMKVEDILVDHEKGMLDISRIEKKDTHTDEVHWERQRKQRMIHTSVRLVKLYAPTAVAGVITIGCLTTSHRQLTSRNAGLTAAYISLQQFLEGYRGRVRTEIGQDRERDVYYASTPVELVEDTPEGPRKVYGSRPGMPGPYAASFTDQNPNWQESGAYNEHFFNLQSQFMTDRLRANGHLFLNEVYDRLSLPRTRTGQIVGWAIKNPTSDDYVEIKYTPMHDFHGTYLLDFNVAGNVIDMVFGVAGE